MSAGVEEKKPHVDHSPLMELQRRMARAVMQPITRDEKMRQRNADGVPMEQEAAAFIKPNDRLSSFERLEIYNRQYWFRLFTSFEEDFPGVQAVVGKKKFEALMRAYLANCPSTSFSLRNLGSKLEAWLRSHKEWAGQLLLLDMVRLEWTHIESFDAAERPRLSPESLAKVGPASTFTLQPYLFLLELSYPVDDLLVAVRNESGSSDTSSNNATVARRNQRVRQVAAVPAQKIFLAVHRMENSIYYKRLAAEEYGVLQALKAGATLEQAIERGFKKSGMHEAERGDFLHTVFATWAMLGWFCESGESEA